MGQRAEGDYVFEAYLVEQGLAVPEHEPDLGIGVRPDYVLEHDGSTCICEVKQFAAGTNSLPGSGGVWDHQTQHKPIRSQIHEGARKLREAEHLGCPLVVVLTNPLRAPVILGAWEMVCAIEGNAMIVAPGPVGAIAQVAGRNGELARDH